ncbi:MAG: hypothetical protein ACI8UO_005826, partial [Verrucomicrobiales bacterium]
NLSGGCAPSFTARFPGTGQWTDCTKSTPISKGSFPHRWFETVKARVGVDTDNDGKADKWSDWSEVKESYDYIPGFSKQVKRTPAQLDVSGLPEGFGFQIELRIKDSTENKSKPMIEGLSLSFE